MLEYNTTSGAKCQQSFSNIFDFFRLIQTIWTLSPIRGIIMAHEKMTEEWPMIERTQLKFAARGYIAGAKPSPWPVILLASAILELLGMLSMKITHVAELQQAMLEFQQTQDLERYLQAIARYTPGFGSAIVDILLSIMSLMITTGIVIFYMRTVRDGKGSFGNLLDGFPVLLRVIVYQFITGIFVFLWSLLLVIPGIVAMYRYRQGLYILLDHPEMDIFDCISASKQMMAGHKGELFVLDLSFIGWNLMVNVLSMVLGSLLPTLAAVILLLPLSSFVRMYTGFTYFLYYEALHGSFFDSRIPLTDNNPPTDGNF